jgi:hypothetical protein
VNRGHIIEFIIIILGGLLLSREMCCWPSSWRKRKRGGYTMTRIMIRIILVVIKVLFWQRDWRG